MSGFEARVKVRYVETDQMGVVHHSNYLAWLELARVEYCGAIGFDYREMEENGVVIAVVDAQLRYLYPARFGDEIAIRLEVRESTAKLLKFGYELHRTSDGKKIARAQTTHLYLSRSEFRPIRLPERYQAAFGVK